ncbi:MAG: hypothetical protein M0T74_15645 [Desulfitobacterium hafniense]|nr:hypothetical protein [Desulfitobacterium hafniense]
MDNRGFMTMLGLVFFGLGIIISSYFLSTAINNLAQAYSSGMQNASTQLSNAVGHLPIQDASTSDLMGLPETAKFLGISEEKFFKNADYVPHVVIGDKYIFSRSALIEWVGKSNYIQK